MGQTMKGLVVGLLEYFLRIQLKEGRLNALKGLKYAGMTCTEARRAGFRLAENSASGFNFKEA